jgi:hypothetical protein
VRVGVDLVIEVGATFSPPRVGTGAMARRTFDARHFGDLDPLVAGPSQIAIVASETHTWRLATSWRSDSLNAPSPRLVML